MFEAEDKMIKAELLSEGHTLLKLRLKNGTELIGYSWGIDPYNNADGEWLGCNALSFRTKNDERLYCITNDEIDDVAVFTEQ